MTVHGGSLFGSGGVFYLELRVDAVSHRKLPSLSNLIGDLMPFRPIVT
jgi:hypothetical protein